MNTISKHGKSHSWKCISALCTKKKSISSLSQISSKTVNPIVCPLRTQSFYCNEHICLVFPLFQHHKEVFLDLGLVYSASLEQGCSELPQVRPCRDGPCTEQSPSWQESPLGYLHGSEMAIQTQNILTSHSSNTLMQIQD